MNERIKKILENHPYDIWLAKDGYWKTYVYDESKNNNRRLISGTTEEKLHNKIVKEHDLAEIRKDMSYDFKSIYIEWTTEYCKTKELSKGTVDRYNNDWDRFFEGSELSNMDIRVIKDMDVVRFLKNIVCGKEEEYKITRKCFTNIKTIIIGTFCYAKTEKGINCIPINFTLKDVKFSSKQFKKVIKKDSEEVFSDEEALMMVDYIISNYKTTRELGVLFALLTGLRVGELCTLKKTDKEGSKLYVQRTEIKEKDESGATVIKVREYPKTEESMNAIELSESACKVFRMIIKFNVQNNITSEYLFYDNEYGRIKSRSFDKKIRRICKTLDIPERSMHKLRKTYSSIQFANGVEEKIVQKQMRHKQSSTTHKYYEFSIRSKEYTRNQLDQADIFKGMIVPNQTQSEQMYENVN